LLTRPDMLFELPVMPAKAYINLSGIVCGCLAHLHWSF